jgi:dihydrodipicolinate synthase/N-acetylneuraminate lyase
LKWNYTVKEVKKNGEIEGFLLCCDNGDSQFLTPEEYKSFKKNRKE